MNRTLEQLKAEHARKIYELEQRHHEELLELQRRLEIEAGLLPSERVADALHKAVCTLNHTDQCSYFYTNWNTPDITRDDYRKRAEKLLDITDEITLRKIFDLMSRGYK